MPSKKKKYNARFPAGRIKKIMQSDEEIGKVAQAVPVIISRTLELFVESLLNKTLKITNSRNAKTLSTSHMKQCIMAEQRFDFLRELVKNIPDINVAEEAANYNEEDAQSSPEQQSYPDSDTPYDLSMQSTSTRATRPKNNGEFKQQHNLVNRHSENGNASMVGNIMSSHEETFATERKGHLKRQTAMSTKSLSDDLAVSPQRSSGKTHSSRESDNSKLNPAIMAFNARNQIHGDQLPAHEDERLAHMGREAVTIKHFRKVESIIDNNIRSPTGNINPAAENSTVIRHTYVLSNSGHENNLPPKLYRTDSAPATAAGNWQAQSHQTMSPCKKSVQHQKRLKHQPQSEPTNFNTLNTSNISAATQKADVNIKPLEIPAPIVNIDFCNKPVVKIDYSNLGNPAQNSVLPIAPLSAPAATISHENMTGFNFNAEPVINIDLSNIVANSSNAHNDPAVATISIGNIAPIPSFVKPLVAAPTNLDKITNSNSTTSPAISTVLETKNDGTPSSSSSVPVPKKSNSFFELDEDYDNI